VHKAVPDSGSDMTPAVIRASFNPNGSINLPVSYRLRSGRS
jgi:hypothetical protein